MRLVGLGALVALALVGACASSPPRAPVVAPPPATAIPPPPLPDVTFRPGEPPRRAVIVAGFVAAPAVTAANLDALSKRLAVPVPLGQELLRALSEGPLMPGVTLSRAQLDQLDPARPIGFVSLMKGIGVDAGLCVAVTFRDAAAARRALDRLGEETARHGGESTRRLPSGATRYAGVHGRTLLLSSTPRTIVLAGPLAEELQERQASSVLTVTVYPHVVMPIDASAVGPILEAKLPAALEAQKGRAATAGFSLSPPFMVAMLRLFFEPLVQTRAVTLTADLSEAGGLSISVGIEPLAETAFARSLAQQFPVAVDAAAPAGASAGLISWGGFGDFMSTLAPIIAASGPRGRELRASTEAFLARVQGSYSCAIERGAPLGWRCAWPLKAGATAADVLRRYAAFAKGTVVWTNEAFGTHTPPAIVVSKGNVLEIERRADPIASPGVAALLGGSSQRWVAAVRGGALVVAQGGAPRALLDAAPSRMPMPEGARGANFVASVDLAAFALSLASASDDPNVRQGLRMIRAIPGLEALRLPVVVTGRSGATARYELQLPIEGLENAARIVVPYMGVMGGTRR